MGAPEAGTAGAPRALDAAIESIRRRREEILDEGNLDLVVPGYDDNLKVRYRDLSDAESDRLSKRLESARRSDDTKAEREVMSQILIAHCDKILVRQPGTEEFIVLEDGNGPIRFSKPLAELMQLPASSAAESVHDLFSPQDESGRRHQPDAIASHVNAIFLWREGRKDAIHRRLLGE